MGRRALLALALASSILLLAPAAEAAGPVVCILPFTDARPAAGPRSVPFKIRTEDHPEPIRAHPSDGPRAVRRLVVDALRREAAVEVEDLSGADPRSLAGDPRLGRCAVLVGGAVFHYEGTVAVDVFGNRTFSGLVGYELVAVDAEGGRRLLNPVVFAGRRQSESVKVDEDFGESDRQIFGQWVAEALKVASASLQERFARPLAMAATGRLGGPR